MPGFVDLQINGYAGVDFNSDQLTGEDLHRCCQALQRDKVDGILATFITDSIETLSNRVQRLVELREQDPLAQKLIWGLHIEGPFISPERGYVGAHPVAHAQPAYIEGMERILDAGNGLVRLVTLAPEMDANQTVTRFLADQGLIVSAGHTNASYDQLKAAIDAGLVMFTHLGNGCPMLQDRHDNIIQRVLSLSEHLWIGFIADGAHIPFFALRNYLKVTGLERVVIVTDAISAAGCGPGRFQLGDRWVNVGADGVPRADDHSHLVGSGTIMSQMALNLKNELKLSDADIVRLTNSNPRRFLEMFPASVAAVQV